MNIKPFFRNNLQKNLETHAAATLSTQGDLLYRWIDAMSS